MRTFTTVSGKSYVCKAWTGGDVPPRGFPATRDEVDIYLAFYMEQVKECGGLDLWECAGTSAKSRNDIFVNRALLDAWRTMNP